MSPRLLYSLIVVGALLASCTDESTSRSPSRAAQYGESRAHNREEGDRPPHIGMTKDEVLNMYGQPVNVSSSARGGEVWSYVFNNFDGRAFIPYYGAYHEATKRRHSGSITFANGRVADFQWNEMNPKAATIFR